MIILYNIGITFHVGIITINDNYNIILYPETYPDIPYVL